MDFLKPDEGKLPINEEDKDWIEENFEWLIQNAGILTLFDNKVINPSELLSDTTTPEEISASLCKILGIDSQLISITLYDDSPSENWTLIAPMGEYEDLVEDYREFEKDGKIHVEITLSKSLLENKPLLASCLAYQLTRVKLRTLGLLFDTGADTGVFLYLASIYYGFGLLISNSVFVNKDGWIAESHIPLEVVGYTLAFHYWLKNEKNSWIENISPFIKPHFDTALSYIEKNPPEVFNQTYLSQLVVVSRIEKEAFDYYDKGIFEKALELNKKLEELDPNNPSVINNTGYFKLRLNRYEESMSDFESAIDLDPDFAFPYNNKGYALIMLDKMDEAYQYINKSLLLDESNSYAYRNLGIYFNKKLDFDSAYQNFKTALELDPNTELIHYYYGMAMLENGDYNEGLTELELSAKLGERESLLKLLEIKGN